MSVRHFAWLYPQSLYTFYDNTPRTRTWWLLRELDPSNTVGIASIYNVFPVFVTWADRHLNERKFLIFVYSSSLFSLASSKVFSLYTYGHPPISFHKCAGCAPTDSCQVRWNPDRRCNKRVWTLKHVHMPRGWVTECRVAMWYSATDTYTCMCGIDLLRTSGSLVRIC